MVNQCNFLNIEDCTQRSSYHIIHWFAFVRKYCGDPEKGNSDKENTNFGVEITLILGK